MPQQFTEILSSAIQEAIKFAESKHHAEVYDAHLLFCLLEDALLAGEIHGQQTVSLFMKDAETVSFTPKNFS